MSRYSTFFRPVILAGLFFLMPVSSLLADGAVEGRVSDQSGEVYFEGAIVALPELNIERVTDTSGRFRFQSVPAGEYQLEVSYVGAEPVSVGVTVRDDATEEANVRIGSQVGLMENIIVVGQAAGAYGAINRMRSADNLISVVTSDSIGQFPDENVSEALQRINGVFVERDQGEGRFVGVRGIDPQLNVASINGLNVPAPESDRRNVALDVIPSDLVESLEVTKTLTPDQDGDAIGGTINIKSLSAFDREGMSYKLKGQSFYNDLQGSRGHKFSGTFTNAFDLAGGELGLAMSISTNEREFGTDNLEADGGWAEDGGVRYHEEMEMRNYEITRERNGLALNLDFRASDTSSYYLRTLYSDFSDLELRNRIEFKLDKGDLAYDNDSLTSTDTRLQRELKDRYEEQEILSVLVGGEHLIRDWTVEYSAGYSEASEEEPGRIDSQFELRGVEYARYENLGRVPSLSYSADGAVAANFGLDEITIEDNFTNDEETAFKFDITRDMTFGGHPGYIRFGAKYRARDKNRDAGLRIFEKFDDAFDSVPTLDQFVSGSADYMLGSYGPYVAPGLQRSFVWGNIGGSSACLLESYDENACPFIMDEDGSRVGSAADYDIEENVTALYLMQRLDLNDLRLVYGVRYEGTDFTAKGAYVREVDVDGQDDVQISESRYESDYGSILPSINLRYKLSKNLVLRGAYTHSIARPSFGDLNPTPDAIEIEQDDDEIEMAVEAGNPELKPYKSRNMDLALEYYPGNMGVFSAGAFYKRIDDFVFNADVSSVANPSEYAGNIAVTDLEVFKPLNGQSASLYGLELGWTRQFTELPGALSGLILMANATFTDSDADLGLGPDADRGNESKLPLQADLVANFVVGYENYGWSVRLSSAFIGNRIAEINLADQSNDLYEDGHHQIDLTVKYDVNEQLQLYFNAMNLGEEPNYRYYGRSRFNGQYDEIGRSYVFGISYRSF
ncbi:MAG: TonB-dependent receptor [Gammaproteobacteria bacterium]|nr:TonB-dependent receptor [Gammaproteobacteria bacterium]